MELINWHIYEISSTTHLINVKCRGRIRKFCLQNQINVLVENASDKENIVRLALINENGFDKVKGFIKNTFPNSFIKEILITNNPVLSKLIINNEERYEI